MNKIKGIEKYGLLYVERFLRQQIDNKEKIYSDWYEALIKFFFTKVFYRGRNDELSERFMNATIQTLNEYKPTKNYDRESLNSRLESNGVNNGMDRQMVLEVLDLIFNSLTSSQNNIVKYTVDEIKDGKIVNVFNTLNKIYCIKDKLASFYLRDVIITYQLEKILKPNDFQYCQPIDTWVKKVVLKINIINSADIDKIKSNKKKNEYIKSAIIKSCLDANISPLLFNAGAWLVGAKSFDLLIENL